VFAAAPARLLSVLGLLVCWEVIARLVGSQMLPPASVVLATLVREVESGALPTNLAITLMRVALAFALAMVLGSVLGIAMGWWRRVDLALDSALMALLNLPALVTIVLIYIWFGLGEASAIVAVALNKLPNTAVIMREGTRALDGDLLEMAHSFRMGRWSIARHIVLPQLVPYLLASSRSGLALIWKIVLVAELLGRSDGVGFQIQVYFQLFDIAGILAYTVAFAIVMQLIEWIALQPLERWAKRWRH
jgi:NitT/TauT family transport system permease protein